MYVTGMDFSSLSSGANSSICGERILLLGLNLMKKTLERQPGKGVYVMSQTEKTLTKDDRVKFRELVTNYLKIMCAGDEEKFLGIWHPDARRFSVGNSDELHSFNLEEIAEYSLKGIRQLREENPKSGKIQHVLDEILHLSTYNNLVAAVEAKWHMIMPDSKGVHHTYFHLARQNDKWLIVNVLDRGYELRKEDS